MYMHVCAWKSPYKETNMYVKNGLYVSEEIDDDKLGVYWQTLNREEQS